MMQPYSSSLPKVEFVFEPIGAKNTNADRIYGPVSAVPSFPNNDANADTQALINIFRALPTHGYYFKMGANAREPASKTLESLSWINNVKMFKCVSLSKRRELSFTIEIGDHQYVNGELREPFKSRLVEKHWYDYKSFSQEPFATFICDPMLAVLKKKRIGYASDINHKRDKSLNTLQDKSMITVHAYTVEDALKIWIAFLDESGMDVNNYVIELFKRNITTQDLCGILAPMVQKFQKKK